jgi:ArsR family transcriptional regulator
MNMELVEMVKLLADETRFKIVMLLLEHDFCVGALARRLGISDAAVSQHIQILRRGGLLKGEKRGYWTHYAVDRDMLGQAAEQLKALASPQPARQGGCGRGTSEKTDGRQGKMCKCNCEHPEKLKDSEGKCSKEQIKECHGERDDHPCEGQEAEKK